MRLLIVLTAVLASAIAELFSFDDVEDLFKKFARNSLSQLETKKWQNLVDILHRPERASTVSLEDSSQVRATLDCLVCRSAFAVVFDAVENGQSEKELTETVIGLCTVLGIESYNVCRGAVALNLPIITHIIRTTPAATPRAFCGLVLQTIGNPNTCRLDDARFEWQVELPAPVPIANVPPFDPRPLKIALLTDAHIDPLYEAFGVADCDEPTCCRIGQTPANSFRYTSNVPESVIEQIISNVTGELLLDLDVVSKIKEAKGTSQTRFAAARNSEPAGYWGDYRNCDSPIWAFDNVIETITNQHKDIDVVYYIGDTIDHGVWETTYDLINEMNRYVIDKIRSSFGDNVLVVPVIGNHESQPTNQFAPSYVTGEKLNTTWLYEALANKWSFYLTEDAKATLQDRGEFSMLIRPGLRVISINNNVAYKYNWWLVYDPLDAKRHLDWLIEELFKAEQAGEKVHILAHIPPGVSDLTYTWTREYNRIVNRFSSTIAAEFNGHTHSDEFKIFYSTTDGSPISVAWGAGSATSYTFYNLNYKILDINTITYAPNNIINYAYNLTEANLRPNRKPHWFQLYDMRNTFGLPDLSPSSIDNLVFRMVTTDKEYLDMYAAFYSKISDARWPFCDDWCKIDNLCKTVVTVLWQRQKCNELQQLFFR